VAKPSPAPQAPPPNTQPPQITSSTSPTPSEVVPNR
jgi:hypothetical protein